MGKTKLSTEILYFDSELQYKCCEYGDGKYDLIIYIKAYVIIIVTKEIILGEIYLLFLFKDT